MEGNFSFAALNAAAAPVCQALQGIRGHYFIGLNGWTVVLTEPPNLLCKQTLEGEPRLAEVTKALGCMGFHYADYDSDSATLLECDLRGTYRVSGMIGTADDPFDFYGLPIEAENEEVGFKLLWVPQTLKAALAAGPMATERSLMKFFGLDAQALRFPAASGGRPLR
jgi:hypothetical protein